MAHTLVMNGLKYLKTTIFEESVIGLAIFDDMVTLSFLSNKQYP